MDGITGEISSPISRVEAEAIAIDDFAHPAKVLESTFIDQVQDGHSEYRSKEVPVWKVLLDHPSQTAIYVSAQRGEVVARRNARWRVFDFFWMLHTMDYQGRDNFNSLLLQVMALRSSECSFGLLAMDWYASKENKGIHKTMDAVNTRIQDRRNKKGRKDSKHRSP